MTMTLGLNLMMKNQNKYSHIYHFPHKKEKKIKIIR